MSTFLYAWNEHSEGAKALAAEMGIKRIKHERSKFKGRADKTVINWGSSRQLPEEVRKCHILNRPENVGVVSNKLHFFNQMLLAPAGEEPRCPEHTDSIDVARQWLVDGTTVVARTILQGSGAEGLVILGPDNPQDWVRAPLYTKYVKKIDEYRVHIVDGKVIDTQRKALKADWEGERNTKIRNLANGYIFAREGFVVPEDVILQATRAMAASGLVFGAVDVIYNQRQAQAYVLEINTAPGLVGTTLKNYAAAFGDM